MISRQSTEREKYELFIEKIREYGLPEEMVMEEREIEDNDVGKQGRTVKHNGEGFELVTTLTEETLKFQLKTFNIEEAEMKKYERELKNSEPFEKIQTLFGNN